MKNKWKIANLLVLAVELILCFISLFYKQISFGWGLGDIFGYLILFGATIIHVIVTFNSRKKGKKRHFYLTILFLILLVVISLAATIWRGSEYPWNGSLFIS